MDTDADGALDCVDGCPNDPNKLEAGACGCGNPEPGAACNDGNPNTTGDVVNGSCQCVGTPAGNVLELTLVTDNNGGTSWEIGPIGGGTPVCNGSGYAPNSTNVASCTVPDGCYELRVFDQGGDGMCCMTGLGGYVLRTAAGLRIIDAAQQGIFAGTAECVLVEALDKVEIALRTDQSELGRMREGISDLLERHSRATEVEPVIQTTGIGIATEGNVVER